MQFLINNISHLLKFFVIPLNLFSFIYKFFFFLFILFQICAFLVYNYVFYSLKHTIFHSVLFYPFVHLNSFKLSYFKFFLFYYSWIIFRQNFFLFLGIFISIISASGSTKGIFYFIIESLIYFDLYWTFLFNIIDF